MSFLQAETSSESQSWNVDAEGTKLIVLDIFYFRTSNRDPHPVIRASHVSVLDILPVHQHVLPTQRPHLALTRHHMALKHLVTVSVHLWRTDGVAAVLLQAGHRLSGREGRNTEIEMDVRT